MTPVTPAFDGTSLIIAGVALAFGLLLLILGIRGRRIGSEPRCRKCGYILTGSTSQVCSECGRTIDNRGVVFGARRRMRVVIVLSLLIVAAAGTFGGLDGYRQLQKVDKYRYYPFSWLIDGGHAGDLAALKELDRRVRADKLSNSQIQKLITEALTEQSGSSRAAPAVIQLWVNMLETLSWTRHVSESQLYLYFDQMRQYSLVVRPHVLAGEPIPVQIRYRSFGPDQRLLPAGQSREIDMHVSNARLLAAHSGEPVLSGLPILPFRFHSRTSPEPVGVSGICGSAKAAITAADLPGDAGLESGILTPGFYQLKCDLLEEVYDYGVITSDKPDVMPMHTRRLTLTTGFEVLTADAPDTVTLVADTELAEDIRSALQVNTPKAMLPFNPPSAGRTVLITTGMQWFGTLPIDVAFEVYARKGTNRWYLGRTALRKSPVDNYNFSSIDASIVPREYGLVDIVLRSSTAAARETVDIFEIWDGELVFKNVPLED